MCDVGPGFLQGGKEPGALVEQAVVEVDVQCGERLLPKHNSKRFNVHVQPTAGESERPHPHPELEITVHFLTNLLK